MDTADCPVYTPSTEQMKTSMEKFVESVESESSKCGICKITTPSGWSPGYIPGQDDQMRIERIRQDFVRDNVIGGVYTGTFTSLSKQTVQKFRQEAERCTSSRSRGDGQNLLAEVETAYWKGSPGNIYGADNQGSLFSDTVKVSHRVHGSMLRPVLLCSVRQLGATAHCLKACLLQEWNPATLESCLSRALATDSKKHKLKGVHTPYLYYGMWKSTFAW